MKTLIGIVLDESSSMMSRKSEVLLGFRQFIEDQQKIVEDSARLFLVKFHSDAEVVLKGVPLEEVKPLTERDYQPQGSTALNDAIAQCVEIMDEEKKADERAICVIMTDGEENCSKDTTSDDIRNIIRTHEKRNDWTFIYIGVEIEQWVRRSGMCPSLCSPGFQPLTPPPTYSSRQSSFGGRQASGLQTTGQNASQLQSGPVNGSQNLGSQEIANLSSAMATFRTSKAPSSKDFFKKPEDN